MTSESKKARSLAYANVRPMFFARVSLSTLTGTLGMLGFSLLIKDTHAYHLVKQPHHPKQQSTFLHEDTPVPMLSIAHKEDDEPKLPRICRMSRRRLLDSLPIAALSIAGIEISSFPVAAMAAEDDTESFLQRGDGFAYRFVPPAEMEAGAKPVKTHLFEVNWKSPTNSKYTFGVTVDPVRIQNLKEVSRLSGVFLKYE